MHLLGFRFTVENRFDVIGIKGDPISIKVYRLNQSNYQSDPLEFQWYCNNGHQLMSETTGWHRLAEPYYSIALELALHWYSKESLNNPEMLIVKPVPELKSESLKSPNFSHAILFNLHQ